MSESTFWCLVLLTTGIIILTIRDEITVKDLKNQIKIETNVRTKETTRNELRIQLKDKYVQMGGGWFKYIWLDDADQVGCEDASGNLLEFPAETIHTISDYPKPIN